MSGTHFYLTLPSNASMDVFPDYKIGSYYMKFPQTFDLNGKSVCTPFPILTPGTLYNFNRIIFTTPWMVEKPFGLRPL